MRLKSWFGLSIVTLLLLALLSASSVWAVVYKWTDDQGKLHFTDDKSNIPLQYRTPDRIERPKGMFEPPAPKKPEVPAAEVEDPHAAANPDETAAIEAPAAEVEEEPKEAMDPELAAILNETKTILENENKQYQHLINKVKLNKFAGKAYMGVIEAYLDPKKKLVQKLRKFKLRSLKAAQKFLQRTAQQDKGIEVGGEDYIERLEELKRRMKMNIKIKKKIIAQLKADLEETSEKS